MNLLFDTNIILFLVRDKSKNLMMRYLNPKEKSVYISFATIVEINSIAFQNNWGYTKLSILEDFISTCRIVEISDFLLQTYISIDAFSQKKHREHLDYSFKTPRNMGKNDLYIAATASLLNLELVTTDGDFDHLSNIFLTVKKVTPSNLKPFFEN
jgi:tRNA(fMet)-specific endonuclease VapC